MVLFVLALTGAEVPDVDGPGACYPMKDAVLVGQYSQRVKPSGGTRPGVTTWSLDCSWEPTWILVIDTDVDSAEGDGRLPERWGRC